MTLKTLRSQQVHTVEGTVGSSALNIIVDRPPFFSSKNQDEGLDLSLRREADAQALCYTSAVRILSMPLNRHGH